MNGRTRELESIRKKVVVCRKCRIWKTRKKAVPGQGPVFSELMAIGQAPGKKEDETGLPFVGRAGKLLDGLLESAGIDRRKIFITSAIKCFPQPPPNRKPTSEELNNCLPYLLGQIKAVNPKTIILLGEVAFSLFFGKTKLKDFRGKRIKKGEKYFFAAYHPAAGLRFKKIRKILEKDFKKLAKIL